MNFLQHVRVSPVTRIELIPFMNMVLLLVAFFFITSWSSANALIHVKIPKAVTSEMLHNRDTTVVITSENVLYIDNKIITLQELRTILAKGTLRSLFIKVDRRASVGRIVDVWNMARMSGVERVNVATDKED